MEKIRESIKGEGNNTAYGNSATDLGGEKKKDANGIEQVVEKITAMVKGKVKESERLLVDRQRQSWKRRGRLPKGIS